MGPRALALRGAIARVLLKVPGGVWMLGGVRRLVGAGRETARLVRQPAATVRKRRNRRGWTWTDEDWEILGARVDEERPFLSSSRLAGRCRYVYKQGGSFIVHEDLDNDWYFCRTPDIHEFFATVAPEHEFVLFTGHTDLAVYRAHRRYLGRSELKAWFAMNNLLEHPKLRARPFGIGALAKPKDTGILRSVQDKELPKRQLFHCQFVVDHNPLERAYCLQQTGIPLGPPLPWAEYLEEVASSYFCISPNGMGIDCARTWEALLLRTIPVVRRSRVTEDHRDFPIIALDDWAEFRSIEFSPELYEQTWNDWDPDELLLDRYVERIERILESMNASVAQTGT